MIVIYKSFFLLLLPFLTFVDAICDPSKIVIEQKDWIGWLPWTEKDYDWGLRIYAEPNCTDHHIYYQRGTTHSVLDSDVRRGDCLQIDPNSTESAASLVAYTKQRIDRECFINFFSDIQCMDWIASTTGRNEVPNLNQLLGPSNDTIVGQEDLDVKSYLMVHHLERKFASYRAACVDETLYYQYPKPPMYTVYPD